MAPRPLSNPSHPDLSDCIYPKEDAPYLNELPDLREAAAEAVLSR